MKKATFDQVPNLRETFNQVPNLRETFDQLKRSSEIQSSDQLPNILPLILFCFNLKLFPLCARLTTHDTLAIFPFLYKWPRPYLLARHRFVLNLFYVECAPCSNKYTLYNTMQLYCIFLVGFGYFHWPCQQIQFLPLNVKNCVSAVLLS